jgi:uncharacterized repeat protein (TIGR01451 family)
LLLAVASGALLIMAPAATAANPSANLDQCANDPAPSLPTNGCDTNANQWVNGNLGASKSFYREGDSIPYRLTFGSLSLASHTVTIEWDTTKAGKHALDYLTSVNQSVTTANPCLGVSGCGSFTTFPIPADPQVTGAGVTPIAGTFRLYGGTITAVSAYSYANGTGFAGDKSARITITFTATTANPVLAWGGHIATRKDWGNGASAVAISGSPYHTRLLDLDGSGGNQDRSLSADAVVFPGFIHIVKNTVGGNATFGFTASPAPLANFSLTGGTEQDFNDITNFTTYTVLENTPPTDWSLTGLTCAVATGTANGGTQNTNLGTRTATINLAEGEQVTCTYTNTFTARPSLSLVKTASPTTYDEVGDIISYSYLVTNTGNVTLAGPVTVTDDKATVTCPAGGLAPGAQMTCTATYTITQADLNSGSVKNTAQAHSNGTDSNFDDETVTANQNPHLSITKEATESGFSAVGDVIHYTITATNDGNVTLASVTVTDAQVSDLSCTPANGSSLAPGASLSCTASHTITLADLDAGSFYNQACVDDGAAGAAQACDDVTTPGTKNPALSIDKQSTTTLITSAGQVVPYTYLVTNTGNVTLHNVTLTDDKVATASITCTPAQPATLAPAASMSCTGSHTVTQAELDAGGNLTNIATADSDETTPQTDTVTIPIQPPVKGHIMHTGVTCANFVSNNPSDELTDAQYGVKSGKVNSVSPGVMFYYISITAPSASFTINVTQSNNATPAWKPIPVSGLNQIILYEANCTKSNKATSSFNATSGTATLSVTGATTGATYIVGIKYSLSDLAGQTVTSPFPVVTYSFATNFNGNPPIASSQDTIVVSPKP